MMFVLVKTRAWLCLYVYKGSGRIYKNEVSVDKHANEETAKHVFILSTCGLLLEYGVDIS